MANDALLELLDPIVTVMAAFLGAYFTMLTFNGNRQANAANVRLEKVYSPLFDLIEKDLYVKIPREQCDMIVSQIKEIAISGSHLTDPKLKELIRLYEKSKDCTPSEYNSFRFSPYRLATDPPDCYLEYWFRICRHIDRTYDRLCASCSYPLRSRSYRLDLNQYCDRLFWQLSFIRFNLPGIVFFTVMLLIMFLAKRAQ